jgi:hypothetical protein
MRTAKALPVAVMQSNGLGLYWHMQLADVCAWFCAVWNLVMQQHGTLYKRVSVSACTNQEGRLNLQQQLWQLLRSEGDVVWLCKMEAPPKGLTGRLV